MLHWRRCKMPRWMIRATAGISLVSERGMECGCVMWRPKRQEWLQWCWSCAILFSHYFALHYNVFRRQLTSWDRCCLRKFPVGTPSNRQPHDDGNLLFVVQHDNIQLESSVNKRWRRQDLWRPRPSDNQLALSFPKAANVAFDSRNEDPELDAAWKQETRQLSTQIGSPIASRSTEGKAYNNQPVLGKISRIELFQIQRNNIQRSGFLEWWVQFLLPSRVRHFYLVRRCLQATMYTRY